MEKLLKASADVLVMQARENAAIRVDLELAYLELAAYQQELSQYKEKYGELEEEVEDEEVPKSDEG